jgi:hypothetical protein
MTVLSVADEHVPVFDSLENVYSDNIITYQRERYNTIKSLFTAKFKVEPEFYVRSPGRVNIIGNL